MRREGGVDVLGRFVVAANRDHDSVIRRRPDGQHSIGTVEVPAANMVEHIAREAIARSGAATCSEVRER